MEIQDLIKAVGDYGLAGTVVILFIILYRLMVIINRLMDLIKSMRAQDTERDKDESKIQLGSIEVMKSLVLQGQATTTILQTMQTNIEGAHRTMSTASERRDQQYELLQASIDKLPASLKAALISDFESVGNLIASVNQGVTTLNQDVQKAFAEYAKMGAKLQVLMETKAEALSGAESAPPIAEAGPEPSEQSTADPVPEG